VLSLIGKRINNIRVTTLEEKSASIDLSQLKRGVYFIVVEDGDYTLKRKIIKE